MTSLSINRCQSERQPNRVLWTIARVVAIFVIISPLALASLNSGARAQTPELELTSMSNLEPQDLIDILIGGGVEVSNVTFRGVNFSAGTFEGGENIVGFDSGVILSTGSIFNVEGPNRQDGISTVTSTFGDADLDALNPSWPTADAVVLEFDFIPNNNVISFQYVFASDEYNDFVTTSFNDVFGFFLDGVNVALVPGTGTPVSINSINKGRPFGSRRTSSNPEFYINNDLDDGGGAINTEMDGLTTVLPVRASVVPGQTHHIKIAIADVSDRLIDSVIFIKSGSFTGDSPPETQNDFATTEVDVPVDVDVLINDIDYDGDSLSVISVTSPISGAVAIIDDSTVRYTPASGFIGTDVFSYAVADGDGGLGTAIVTVDVTPVGGGTSPQDMTVYNSGARFTDVDTSYDSSDARAGSGVYTIDALFTNTSGQALTGVAFEVVILSGNNVLLNADNGPGGRGSTLTVSDDILGDGELDPGESFRQEFEIGVFSTQPFSFFVDVLGVVP